MTAKPCCVRTARPSRPAGGEAWMERYRARGRVQAAASRRLQEGMNKLEASVLRCDESLFVLSEL